MLLICASKFFFKDKKFTKLRFNSQGTSIISVFFQQKISDNISAGGEEGVMSWQDLMALGRQVETPSLLEKIHIYLAFTL